MDSPVISHGSPSTTTMSSPSRSSSLGSAQQLTPRSKIKAMLAAVDDESESEVCVEASTKQDDFDRTHPLDRSPTSAESPTHESKDSDAEESDDGPVVPRGRLAARLQSRKPVNGTRNSSDDSTEAECGENAYERIKKQLLPRTSNKRASPEVTEQQSLGSVSGTPVASGTRERLPARKASRSSSSRIATPLGSPKLPPGLFLTPGAASPPINHQELAKGENSDSNSPDPHANQRFLTLVARKRAEREAKQAAEAEKKAAREARLRKYSVDALGVSEDESDNNASARRLTQQARPTRKASKRALEEMNRETQRMNRNMQLAHQAKTKKKITKESLFARFNFRTSSLSTGENQQTTSSSTVASSVHGSDAENGPSHQTPPTSPLIPSDAAKEPMVEDAATDLIDTSAVPDQPLEPENELPDIQEMIDNPQPVLKKGKGKAIDLDYVGIGASANDRNTEIKQPQTKVSLSMLASRSKQQDTDTDSDLEILPRQSSKSRLDAFNRLPTKKAREARSLQTLHALAQLHSPGKQKGRARATMTQSEMQTSLRQRARQQAAAERAEKIQELKNKGVIIQTAEERQKDQAEVEDLVEKARKEAEEIKRKEKDAVRKEKRANGELATLADSSDEDEDYQQDEEIAAGVELSGSDEEDAVDEDNVSGSENGESDVEDEGIGGVDVGDNMDKANRLIEDEASEDSEDESSGNCSEVADDERAEDEEIGAPLPRRKARANRVIDDDEDDDEPLPAPTTIQEFPTENMPGKPIIPGLGMNGGPILPMMGMTQAFAATMADTQSPAFDHTNVDQEQDSLRFLGPVPEPDLPVFDPEDTESMVVDSQAGVDSILQDSAANEDISLHFSQSQIQYDTAQETLKSPAATQDEDIPDPTQDVGFGMSSPAANRFVLPPPSTVDTVLLTGEESPVKKKKGRLQRGKDAATNLSNDDAYTRGKGPAGFEISANAFDVMKKKRAAAATTKPYDKSKSEAKEMVEEEAFESEDEYAGLGGASDDEIGGSEDEETRKMIEHGDVEVDERKLAAFYA